MAEVVEDTGKRKIDNGEAWERYVKRFRSNSEAAEQFIADEKLVGNEDQRRWLKKKKVHQDSAALISANDSKGLGTLSEEPLEHNNKKTFAYTESI